MASNNKAMQMAQSNLTVVLVLVTLLAVGGSVLVGRSLLNTILRDARMVGAQQKAEKQLDANLTAAPLLVNEFQSLGTRSGLIADALPNSPDFPSLLVMLENMANEAGARIKSITPALGTTDTSASGSKSTSSQKQPQNLAFTMTYDGSYTALQKFLGALELSARPIRVTGLQLNGTGSALTGQISAETYYQDKAGWPFRKEALK